MAKDLLQDLRVLPALEPERGAGVAEAGRADIRQSCPLGERLEGPTTQDVGAHRRARLRRENEAMVLQQGVVFQLLPELALAVSPQSLDHRGQKVDRSPLARLGCFAEDGTIVRRGQAAPNHRLPRLPRPFWELQVLPLEGQEFAGTQPR